MQRLITKYDLLVEVVPPVTPDVVAARRRDYPNMSARKFGATYNSALFSPVLLNYEGEPHEIQVNFCGNPFCRWFGMPQDEVPSHGKRPAFRYRLSGAGKAMVSLFCNQDDRGQYPGIVLNHSSLPFSNWSLADEIARLVRHNQIINWEPVYDFHNSDCPFVALSPWDNRKHFTKRGKSTGGGQKWRCKTCMKSTSELPTQEKSFGYNQKRNDILVDFTLDLLNRSPVRRTCEKLDTGVSTYYNKLEWVYRKCLEFLNRRETEVLKQMTFDNMSINTDALNYYLNNVRIKGKGGTRYDDTDETVLATHIVASAHSDSRYVLRCDLAYDWDITLLDIEEDTKRYFDDHLHSFSRKNDRLRIPFCPQPRDEYDLLSPLERESSAEYQEFLEKSRLFALRGDYADGLHVNSTYTAMAHYWLIKQMLNVKRWFIISDKDNSLSAAFYRIFVDEIQRGYGYNFYCKTDRDKSLKEAFAEYTQSRKDLREWGKSKGFQTKYLAPVALARLQERFRQEMPFEFKTVDGKSYPVSGTMVPHPLSVKDRGIYEVGCGTDLSFMSPDDLAKMLFNVNSFPVDAFFQQIRRRLSILERPLITARNEGKSYIYANCNPKYAQYALTILRTYYNFCVAWRDSPNPDDLLPKTPAQRLGLTIRKYSIEDILYHK